MDASAAVDEGERDEVRADFEERARPHLFRDGKWFADYRGIRVVAVKAGR